MITQTVSLNTLATQLDFPEGPAFDQKGDLWVVELKGGNLVRISEGKIERFPTEGNPNGIAIDKAGRVWFCDAGKRSIRIFYPTLKIFLTVATHIEGETLNKPNDLVFDEEETLVFSCPGESRQEPTGYVCARTKDGKLKKITDNKYFPNGLAFTPDGRSLIIAETYKHRLWKGDWNAAEATWSNAAVWCDIGGPDGAGGPDGMAFAPNGNLYVAVYGTGRVRVVNPEGKVIDEIPLPGKNPTNCAFDPNAKKGLVVTEAENGICYSIIE